MAGSSTTTPLRQDARTPDWAMADVQEFVPRRVQDSSMVSISLRDPCHHLRLFLMAFSPEKQTNENEIPVAHSFETFQPTHATNPYLDHGLNGAAFYQGPSAFQQPVSLAKVIESPKILISKGAISPIRPNRPL